MSITDELKKALTTAKEQIFSRGHLTDNLTVTKKCLEQAEQWGLTEADVKAVYNHGTLAKTKHYLITKDYNGYSLTISSFFSPRTGHPVISSIWKREKTYAQL